jgi:hypothetical protein
MKLGSLINKWFLAFMIGRNTALAPAEADYKMVILRGNLALVGWSSAFVIFSLTIGTVFMEMSPII